MRLNEKSKLSKILIFLYLWTLGSNAQNANAQAHTVQHVEAAFLYNFAKFVEWPAGTFADASDPMTIGILGIDHFGEILDNTIEGKTINNRKLMIKRFKQYQIPNSCQILFISSSEKENLVHILDNLRNLSVLTVSDMEGFAQFGGVINFYVKENKVRFEINVDAGRRANLKISSKLLKLAKIIHEEDG